MILINREAKGDADLCASCGDYQTAEELIMMIKTTYVIDVVPVVRCKDCKYLMFSDFYSECGKGYMGIVRPDDFCSRGERKEGVD